jgi:thiamine biosynthesis protein ThiI
VALLLLRYGEIALKGQNRNYFFRKLRRNVRKCLKENSLHGKVWQEGQRVYAEVDRVDAATEAISRVFGIVSLSPVEVVPIEPGRAAQSLAEIGETARQIGRRAGLGPATSFRISARRADKSYPYMSPEIERRVGAVVADDSGAPVDLEEAAIEIGVEVQPGRALIFGEVIPGPGGLPLGTQGRVVALLSTGIDSPVAVWLMMKRGCSVIPVHFAVREADVRAMEAVVAGLNHWGYGWRLRPVVLSHEELLVPTLERLRELNRDRWACLFCKRAMLAAAAKIAEEMGAAALVTGDSLGQVASQTLSNLEVISYGIGKPILRPLIGLDKTEIVDLARHIGTYEASVATSHACPFLPDRPLTRASVAKLTDLLLQMESLPDVHAADAEAQQPGRRAELAAAGRDKEEALHA